MPWRALTLLLIGVALGAVLGWQLAEHDAPSSTSPEPSTGPAIDPSHAALYQQVQQQLQQQQQQNDTLRQEIVWLESIIDELSRVDATADPGPDDDATPPEHHRWFDQEALARLGYPRDRIQQLKAQVEAVEMEKLQLRTRARREGWARSGRLYREIKALDEALRQKLSPAEYDITLYATGRNNRLEVTDTLADSPAALAGLQPGDTIVRYDGERVLAPQTLYRGTAKGEPGELVSLQIRRDGETLTLYVPRGPLGTRFRPTRGEPIP